MFVALVCIWYFCVLVGMLLVGILVFVSLKTSCVLKLNCRRWQRQNLILLIPVTFVPSFWLDIWIHWGYLRVLAHELHFSLKVDAGGYPFTSHERFITELLNKIFPLYCQRTFNRKKMRFEVKKKMLGPKSALNCLKWRELWTLPPPQESSAEKFPLV